MLDMKCLNKKLNDICIICKFTNYFTIIVYEDVINGKNIIDHFLEFDMEIIIPLLRTSFLKWYKKFKNELLDNKEYIETVINSNVFSFIKKLIIIKENSSDETTLKFIHQHSGLIALEYVKSGLFKELIDVLKMEKK
tara:strand:+ start:23 stop:433 length:411 start_codon:yes stop_codon:yes gene_type:complete